MARACFMGRIHLEPVDACFMVKHMVLLRKCSLALKCIFRYVCKEDFLQASIFLKIWNLCIMSSQYFVLLHFFTVFRYTEKMSLVSTLLLWWDCCSQTGEWRGCCLHLLPQWPGWRLGVGESLLWLAATTPWPDWVKGCMCTHLLPHPPNIEKKLPFFNLEKQPTSHSTHKHH